MSIKSLIRLKPGQKYWTFDPYYGKSAKIRFDIVRRKLSYDTKLRLLMGFCFASKEDALQAKQEMM